MEKLSVLIVHGFKPDHLTTLDDLSEDITISSERARTPEEVAGALDNHPNADVLYTIHTPKIWSPRWNIQWIQIHFAGADHIPLDAIPQHLELTTASGANSVAVAEHAFALILALSRDIPGILDNQRERLWPESRNRWKTFALPLLRGKTIGILGYGSIGREIARMSKAFGMNVLACKRNQEETEDRGFILPGTGDPDGSIPDSYYGHDRLHDMFHASDIIVNALPATPETTHLLDEQAFKAMKPSSIFISIGRGKTVDEKALIEAIVNGQISGAGLDVFDTEPLPSSSPLWQFKNVIISPHIGGFFSLYDETAMILFRENLGRYLSGKPLLNRVHRKLGY